MARDDLFSGVHLLEDETFLWHNGRFLHRRSKVCIQSSAGIGIDSHFLKMGHFCPVLSFIFGLFKLLF